MWFSLAVVAVFCVQITVYYLLSCITLTMFLVFPLIFNKQRFHASIEQTKSISEYSQGFLHKLLQESKILEDHVTTVNDFKMKSIDEFQKAYEVRCIQFLLEDYIFKVSDKCSLMFFRSSQSHMQRILLLVLLI